MFSVIIPTVGRPEALPRAIRSVLTQDRRDYEIIVVNDSGGPLDLDLVPGDDRIVVLDHGDHEGPSSARNAGIRKATGDVLMFLDDDDEYLPGRFDLVAEGLERSLVSVCEPSGRSLRRRTDRGARSRTGMVESELASGRIPVGVGGVAIRRSAAPLFDERYRGCEDWDWWLRLPTDLSVTVGFAPGWRSNDEGDERVHHGNAARIDGSKLLLHDHRAFFERHPQRALVPGAPNRSHGAGIGPSACRSESLSAFVSRGSECPFGVSLPPEPLAALRHARGQIARHQLRPLLVSSP